MMSALKQIEENKTGLKQASANYLSPYHYSGDLSNVLYVAVS